MRDLSFYLSQPYTKVVRRDPDGRYIASVQELPACAAHGESEIEALQRLAAAQREWLEVALEGGVRIPVPTEEEALPSGRWLQRVPRSLHARLVAIAREEGISLNQLVTAVLAEAVGTSTAANWMERAFKAMQSGTLSTAWTEAAGIDVFGTWRARSVRNSMSPLHVQYFSAKIPDHTRTRGR